MKSRRRSQHHAARQFSCGYAGQIQSCALPSHRLFRPRAHAPGCREPAPVVPRENLQFIFLADGSRNQCPRHYRAEALHGEHAVNGKPGKRGRIPGRNIGGEPVPARCLSSSRPAPVSALTGDDGECAGSRNESAQKFLDFQSHDVQGLAVNQVGLGQHRDAAASRQANGRCRNARGSAA